MFPLTYVYQEQVSNAVVKFYSVFFLSTSVEIPWLNTCLDISMVPECFKLFFAEYILSQIFDACSNSLVQRIYVMSFVYSCLLHDVLSFNYSYRPFLIIVKVSAWKRAVGTSALEGSLE